ncbi:MAG: YfiR family protein [Pseudomonadota bacterium]
MTVDSLPARSLSRRRLLRWCWLVMPWAGLARATTEAATAGQLSERSVKAAFLYKFLGYTEFPSTAFANAAAPLVIGVLGADEVALELGRIVAGRSVNNRAIVIRALREGEAGSGVHLLFVGGADSARVQRAVRAAPAGPLLLVSEADNALQLGSVINFRIIDDRVRFDVSLEAADRNNVKLSSRLLTVAHQVLKGPP